MKKAILSLAAICMIGLGASANAATLNFEYIHSPSNKWTLSLYGTQAGDVFTVDNAQFGVISAGVPTFAINTFGGGFNITGWLDENRGTYNTVNKKFDLAIIAGSISNSCYLVDSLCIFTDRKYFEAIGRNMPKWVQNFDATKLTQIAAVPLPASLPLLAAGLGLFGFIARRRRANA